MIDPKEHGIEEGDRIRITVEGVVEKGGLYDPYDLHVGRIGLRQLPISVPIEPTVEILEKAEPKWWSAQVIKADVRDVTGDFGPERGVHLLNQGGEYWCGTEGDPHRDLLFNVEVIVQ